MRFSDYKYERPNYEEYKGLFLIAVDNFNNANSFDECKENLEEVYALSSKIYTMQQLASIRHSINTEDKFYSDENEFWDEYTPLFEELDNTLNKAIVESKYKEDLRKEYGNQYINTLEFKLKAFSKDIIEDLQEENALVSDYDKLIASAKINLNGEEKNLMEVAKYMQDTDRNVRKEASEAYWNFFNTNKDNFDEIYDKLVKVRTKIAKKLGYNNFVELGYVRMLRTDYNAEMVKNYRKQVKEYIVPLATKLYEEQKERLALESLKYYDLPIEYLEGNASPKGDSKWILDQGKKMYSELSKETKEFFEFMVNKELLDLETKKGKSAGGYCTYINDYKSPFIFSNFNGTSGDVDVLTHEAGHAFQVYSSSWIKIPDLMWPTYESCEIHSMSMEFLTWPWMENFFKEEADKYKKSHLEAAIKFIPYGVTVDEFQHFIYENPEITPEERRRAWRDIEKKYLPHKDYDRNSFLEEGGFWFKQGHIFQSPFYYIDYTLAQICALQFWKRSNENREEAWDSYLDICKIGGMKSFLEIVKTAKLISPFEDGCVSNILDAVNKYLNN